MTTDHSEVLSGRTRDGLRRGGRCGVVVAACLVFVILACSAVPAGAKRPPTGLAPLAAPSPGTVLVRDSFTRPDGLVANEYAFWNPTSSDAIVSPTWEMTSGSLFARNGFGYTGVPDAISPNATSSNGTSSAVFRLNTRRFDLGNVAVNFRLSNLGFTQTSATPPVAWDGIHVLLRYQSEHSLYYASINRRDGTAVIKKKVPGGPSNDGTYFTLVSAAHAIPMSRWQAVRADVVTNSDGSVTMRLLAGGVLIVQATDSGTGGPPITQPGAVGIRGDNDRFQFDDFTVTAL